MPVSVQLAVQTILNELIEENAKISMSTAGQINFIEEMIPQIAQNFDDLIALHEDRRGRLELLIPHAAGRDAKMLATAISQINTKIGKLRKQRTDSFKAARVMIARLTGTKPELVVFNPHIPES